MKNGDRSHGSGKGLAAERRTRACFITVEFHGLFRNGGIGTANTALALALAARGFDVTVAIANADESGPRLKLGNFAELQSYWQERGITLDYVPPHVHIAGAFDDPRTASYCVFQYLQNHDFDIVLFNDNGGQGYYSLLAKHTGVFKDPPLMVVVAHGPIDWVHELNSLEYYSRAPVVMAYLERRSADLADILVSPSQYLLDWMTDRGWVPRGHGQVLQNLLGIDELDHGHAGRTDSCPVSEIVFFGRQEIRKGVSLFCDALDLLDQTTDLSAVTVTFLGKFGRIGSMHSGVYVAERARRWRSALRILSVYDQTEALDYLRRSGALAVIPSRAENSPCVVAECLQLGLLFLATDSGGTAELVAPEDRGACLFPPEPTALAQRLRAVLSAGHRRAHLAVPPTDTLARWIQLLGSPATDAPAPVTDILPRVSVCLVWSKSQRFQACYDSLLRQSHPPTEIIVTAADEPPAREALSIANHGMTVLFGTYGSHGAARNAAARHAIGDYLLFVDETTTTLLPDAVATLATAAARTGVDILTGFRDIGPGRGLPRPDAREWELPIGACAELGALENCFGEGAVLVRAGYFASRAGFADDCVGAALDWLFLAGAVLDGATLEVVPRPLLQLREHPEAVDGGERTVEDHRRILRAYRNAPIETISHITECNLRIGRQNAQKMQRALQEVSKPARELALRLASLSLSVMEENRLFVQYCCERRMVRLALDFALHNEVPFLPETVTAASVANETAAVNLLGALRLDIRHEIDLTRESQSRARPFYRLDAADLERAPDGSLAYFVPVKDSIIKIAGACPPGTLGVRLTAVADAAGPVRVAAISCRPWARPLLSDVGILPDDSTWWSGWVDCAKPGIQHEVTIALPEPVAELLDLYLIVRRAESGPATPIRISWKQIAANLSLVGGMTPSAIEMATAVIPLPVEQLKRGKLLTDVSHVPFPVFVPGERTLLHPLPGIVSLARVPEALSAGASGLQCVISLEHEKARAVEFAVWVRPTSAAVSRFAELTGTESFSGWILVDVPLVKRTFTLWLAEPATASMDIYLATRVVNSPDAYFCHAYWHEFSIVENSSRHPQSQLPVPKESGHTSRPRLVKSNGETPRLTRAESPSKPTVRRCYLLCAAARTGSNLLASALRRSSVGGIPFEYFNAVTVNDDDRLRELGIASGTSDLSVLAERLDLILTAGTSENGIFGATVHWWDLDRLLSVVGKIQARDLMGKQGQALDGLRSFFPGLGYVWLRRENKIAQAISHYIATRSGSWLRRARDQGRVSAPAVKVEYDFAAIKEFVVSAEAEESGWRGFLSGSELSTLSLTYEELAADYTGTVMRTLAFLGVTARPEEVPPPAMLKQGDSRSLEWEQRYRAEELAYLSRSAAQHA
jgi:LPS sulfotransferase NodH/glycosyltransferase involved in cell wall biosynthesis